MDERLTCPDAVEVSGEERAVRKVCLAMEQRPQRSRLKSTVDDMADCSLTPEQAAGFWNTNEIILISDHFVKESAGVKKSPSHFEFWICLANCPKPQNIVYNKSLPWGKYFEISVFQMWDETDWDTEEKKESAANRKLNPSSSLSSRSHLPLLESERCL